MCGIVGFSGHRLDEQSLLRAVHALHHRGPDGEGIFLAEEATVGLGHARLSIIDLNTGQQPLFSEEGDIALVCNGEIYDFERVRSELQDRGHRFATGSDSEVIIHLYQEYGQGFVQHLRGEFAFLLYDRRARVLLAVRDRFGIKPLYFNKQDDKYLFASEAKGIFATGFLKPAIDVLTIRDYLSGAIPETIFAGVQAIPPGCLMRVDLAVGTHEIQRYWDLDLPANDDLDHQALESYVAAVKEVVEEAVRLRMRADVPVGVYLSGGIDSAIVAALAAKSCSGKLQAFTVSFPNSGKYDELNLARGMANAIGAELHSVSCDNETLVRDVTECLWACELPFTNFHGVGKFVLSRLAHAHVKVVLTGEGADETFLGYPYFQPNRAGEFANLRGRGFLRRYLLRRLPESSPARAITRALGYVPFPMLSITLSNWWQARVRSLFAKSLRARLDASHPLLRLRERSDRTQTEGRMLTRQIQYFSIKQMLAPYILAILGDRVEMGHSIEARTPFLDHLVFEKVREVPDQLKIRDGIEKFVLREAFREELTEELYNRKKWPYLAPPLWIAEGGFSELDLLIRRYLSREGIERSQIFDYGAVRFIRLLHRMICRECHFRGLLNNILTFCLTVQLLDDLFVRNFDANLNQRSDPATSGPLNPGMI